MRRSASRRWPFLLAESPYGAISSNSRRVGGILAQSPRQRADAFALYARVLDAAKALGAGIYVYHGPVLLRGAGPRMERWREGIEQSE